MRDQVASGRFQEQEWWCCRGLDDWSAIGVECRSGQGLGGKAMDLTESDTISLVLR